MLEIRIINKPTRILIIRFSSIGDIVLTSPVVRALKQQLDGEVQLDFITKKSFANILESNPYIDNVITIEKHVSEVSEFLSEQAYDYVIDLHSNLRSRQVKRAVKALSFTVDKRNFAKWLYVLTKKEMLPIGHFTDRCLAAVSALGVENDGKGLDYFIPESQEVSVNQLPELFHKGFITYAIGGQMAGKILPTKKIIELCEKINRPIVLLGGKEDAARGFEISLATDKHVWNTCGKLTLHQSTSFVKQSECLITHDTGLMHIGAALKKRVISLWFATTPQLGFAPWQPGEGSIMLEADCKKRPTSKLGNRGFEDRCVFNLDLDRVAELVNN